MAIAIKGRKIEWVCTIHGLKYGKRPTPNPNAIKKVGYCDICQEMGVKDAPQTIRKVSAYIEMRLEKPKKIKGKLVPTLFTKFIEPKN